MKSAAKKANHCGPISTRSNSIAKSTHWYETSNLGVDIEDLTFGTVDVAQIDALFKELEFGPRTKSRVLKTFNTGAKHPTHPELASLRIMSRTSRIAASI